MLENAVGLLGALFGALLSDPKTIIVIAFVALVIAGLAAFGINRAAVSRVAMVNTLSTFAILAINLVLAPVIYLLAEGISGLYARLGVPALSPAFWEGWHWLAVAIIGLIGKDFSDYWCHRLLHTSVGWPIHAVHHSDSHVNGFTTFRVHALELVTMKAMYILLLSWMGIPAELIAGAYVFAALHNAYIHIEADIDHGPLNWLIASPRFHRWHHADLPEAYGKNLANMIPLWDVMFGTYYRHDACHEPMGLAKDGIPATDPVRLVLLPFVMWIAGARRVLAGGLKGLPGACEERHKPGA